MRLRIKYGMEGYGLYWYCLELIARNVDKNNLTFELEHDSEVISHDTGIHYERVQELMTYMVELGLFTNNTGTIACLKMAMRLDDTTSRHPEIKRIQDLLRSDSEETPKKPRRNFVQNRIEQNRTEQNKLFVGNDVPDCPHQKIIDAYHEILPELPKVRVWTPEREKYLRTRWREDPERQTVGWWERFFKYIRSCPHLLGQNDRDWTADLEWIVKPKNFVKIFEGRYEKNETAKHRI